VVVPAGSKLSAEQFPALVRLDGVVHAFTQRVPNLDVRQDKAEALRRLDGVHRAIRESYGLGALRFATAQQVHGNEIHVIDSPIGSDECADACDGFITNQRDICLGIYVADCCAVYLVDPVRGVIGLVHSGKKGTELDIAGKAIDLMRERFGSAPQDMVVQLSPCIRPPHYEIDFAGEIVRSCRARGVTEVHDSGICTACHPERYYSYRAEKGKTGRMLALLALTRPGARN
jgi:copper oxidase (laccase) domain-containing protein